MAEGGSHVVTFRAPVVGQLDLCMARVVAVAHERKRVFVFRIFRGTQQLHAQHLGVKIDGTLEIADAQHGVEKSHDLMGPSKLMRGFSTPFRFHDDAGFFHAELTDPRKMNP